MHARTNTHTHTHTQTAVTAATALAAVNVAPAAATAVANAATAEAVARSAETVRLKDVVAAEALAAKTLAAATATAIGTVTAAAGTTALVASDTRVAAAQAAFLVAKDAAPPDQTPSPGPKSPEQAATDLAFAIAAQAAYEEVDAVTQGKLSQASAAADNHVALASTIRVNAPEKKVAGFFEVRRTLTYTFAHVQVEAASTLLANQQAADAEAVRVATSASEIASEVCCV